MREILELESAKECILRVEDFANAQAARQAGICLLRKMMASRLRDGNAIPSEWTVRFIDRRGKVVDVLTSARVALDGGLSRHRYQRLYTAAPHPYLVLAPNLTILEANSAYLTATMTGLSAIRDRHVFEVFPDNPGDVFATGRRNLDASLSFVLEQREPHSMARQRYDIQRADGTWEERWWDPVNFPLLDENGKVEFIVHHVRDVTGQAIAGRGRGDMPIGYCEGKARDCELKAKRGSNPRLSRQLIDLAAQWRELAAMEKR
ncbi:MAG TPA: PAS domain-containing protein [Methylocella sp.]|nr:PAS domain-containing protein [Methylocella sp.]